MEKLYVFGTGNAQATRCYNTCFAIRDEDEYFMVDAGGGNGILRVLEDMDVDLCHIHNIFVTHEHTDHILGIVWMVRMIARFVSKTSARFSSRPMSGISVLKKPVSPFLTRMIPPVPGRRP